MHDEDSGRVLRGLRRVLRAGRLVKSVTTGAVLWTAVLLAWLPVNWSRLVERLDRLLVSWGLFPGSWLVLLGMTGAVLALAVLARVGGGPRGPDVVRPLRWPLVLLLALAILVATGLVLSWLMELASGADDSSKARIDAVRTAMTLGAGLVGVVVLVLTARKQWLAEHTQKHAETDATEQRVTELYTAAADQLASEKAPVRMAGLYALERLAQNNPDHRQTIVNLLCAYLRMPYRHPNEDTVAAAEGVRPRRLGLRRPGAGQQSSSPLAHLIALAPELSAAASQLNAVDQQQEELQVRLTAQRLLTEHLRLGPGTDGNFTNPDFWRDLDLDLTGAVLHDWNFATCRVRRADFTGTHFQGPADFKYASFERRAEFTGACFHGSTEFDHVTFDASSSFTRATFVDDVDFQQGRFHGDAAFYEVRFHGHAEFDGVWFHENAGFFRATFQHTSGFRWVNFFAQADFGSVTFCAQVDFGMASFEGVAEFEAARARLDSGNGTPRWPNLWTVLEVDPPAEHSGEWGEPVPPAPEVKAEEQARLSASLFEGRVPAARRAELYWSPTKP